MNYTLTFSLYRMLLLLKPMSSLLAELDEQSCRYDCKLWRAVGAYYIHTTDAYLILTPRRSLAFLANSGVCISHQGSSGFTHCNISDSTLQSSYDTL
jgi:hypothetical protein